MKEPRLALGEEWVPPNEAAVIAQIQAKMGGDYDKEFPATSKQHRPRDVHRVCLGCPEAFFIVPALPAELQVGLFAKPGKYSADIRYSIGQGDREKFNIHGMAIKVKGVPGKKVLPDEEDATTQDFVLADSETFFVRDSADYLEFVNGLPHFVFPSINPLGWRLREAWNLFTALKTLRTLAETQFYSQLPDSFGGRAVKYSVKPRIVPLVNVPKSAKYLRSGLVKQLDPQNGNGIVLDFMVQFQTDAVKMPVEDPRIKWASPFVTVATIVIPPQNFDTAEREAYAENLSFTPWHSLPEHRPLGGIHRVRKVIYALISKKRHTANGVPRLEP